VLTALLPSLWQITQKWRLFGSVDYGHLMEMQVRG